MLNPRITVTQGSRKDSKPDVERIDDEFTINTFKDITDQRTVFARSGQLPDQVPFQLGIKGPMSLRGRELTDDGAEKASTPAPHSIATGGRDVN